MKKASVAGWLGVVFIGAIVFRLFHFSLLAGLLTIPAMVLICPLLWPSIDRKFRRAVPRFLYGTAAVVITVVGINLAMSAHQIAATDAGFSSVADYEAATEEGLTAGEYAERKSHREALLAEELGRQKAAEEKARQDRAAAEAKIEESCRNDFKCWAKRHEFDAGVACKAAAEKQVKFDFEWTDGWADPVFSRIGWANKKTGSIFYLGDQLKLQNGFGNFMRHIYKCEFDTSTGTVVSVLLSAGRLN